MVHFLIRKWYTFKLVYTKHYNFVVIIGKKGMFHKMINLLE